MKIFIQLLILMFLCGNAYSAAFWEVMGSGVVASGSTPVTSCVGASTDCDDTVTGVANKKSGAYTWGADWTADASATAVAVKCYFYNDFTAPAPVDPLFYLYNDDVLVGKVAITPVGGTKVRGELVVEIGQSLAITSGELLVFGYAQAAGSGYVSMGQFAKADGERVYHNTLYTNAVPTNWIKPPGSVDGQQYTCWLEITQ